jgi:hypothetical protein
MQVWKIQPATRTKGIVFVQIGVFRGGLNGLCGVGWISSWNSMNEPGEVFEDPGKLKNEPD